MLPSLVASVTLVLEAMEHRQRAAQAAQIEERIQIALTASAARGRVAGERGLAVATARLAEDSLAGGVASELGGFDLAVELAAIRQEVDASLAALGRRDIGPLLRSTIAGIESTRRSVDHTTISAESVDTLYGELLRALELESEASLEFGLYRLGQIDSIDLVGALATLHDLNALMASHAQWLTAANTAAVTRDAVSMDELIRLNAVQVRLVAAIDTPDRPRLPRQIWSQVGPSIDAQEAVIRALRDSAIGSSQVAEILTATNEDQQMRAADLHRIYEILAEQTIASVGQVAEDAERVAILSMTSALLLLALIAGLALRAYRSVHAAIAGIALMAWNLATDGRHVNGGDPLAAAKHPPIEAAPIREAFVHLASHLGLVLEQSEALAAGDIEAEVLSRPVPGYLGAATRKTIQRLRRTSVQLRDLEVLYRAAVDGMAEALIAIDRHGRLMRANSVARELLEGASHVSSAFPQWQQLVGKTEVAVNPVGKPEQWMLVTASRLDTSDGDVVVMSWRDVSAQHSKEGRLSRLAQQDELTGLLNHRGVQSAIEAWLERSSRVGLIYVDLDHFKDVNDQFGHKAGDDVLRQAAALIQGAVRRCDLVGRLGGAEYIVIVDAESSDVAKIATNLRVALDVSLTVSTGAEIPIKATIGWSMVHPQAAEELMRQADLAMYRAKPTDHDVVSFSSSSTARCQKDTDGVELRRVIGAGTPKLFGQRVVDATTGETALVEVLVRWSRPDGKLLSPVDFVPLAEQSGVIGHLDRWVLRDGIGGLGDSGPRLSLNVSGHTLVGSDFPAFVRSTLASTDVRPERIMLELTETHPALGSEAAASAVERLRDLGVAVALDDFGAGYSSLINLLRLSVSSIKVDRLVTANLDSRAGIAMVEMFVGFGRKLGLEVIAEGVETEWQARRLSALGCELQQGFLYGSPAPLSQLIASVASEIKV